MTSDQSGVTRQDLFTAEVRLFGADVDLALRGGFVAPADNLYRPRERDQQPDSLSGVPHTLDSSPTFPSQLQ